MWCPLPRTMLEPRPETIRGRGDTEGLGGREASAGEKLLKVNSRAELRHEWSWRQQRRRQRRHSKDLQRRSHPPNPLRPIWSKANYVSTLRCDRSGASGFERKTPPGSTRDLDPRWPTGCQEANAVDIKTLGSAPSGDSGELPRRRGRVCRK